MIPILLAIPTASQEPAEYQAWRGCWPWPRQCHRTSSQPVWSDACWAWHAQWTQVYCCLLHGWLSSWGGKPDDGVVVVELVSPWGDLPRISGLQSEREPQCAGHRKVGDVRIFFVCVCVGGGPVDAFQHCFLCLQSLWTGFGRGTHTLQQNGSASLPTTAIKSWCPEVIPFCRGHF